MRRLLLLCALWVLTPVQAGDEQYVTGINTRTLYVYDDAGDEIAEIKADEVKRAFVAVPGDSNDMKGLPIEELDAEEGLVKVSLAGYDSPVWLETMAIEIWPDNRLKCPEVTVGRPEIEQSGMTIGFGEHCDDSGDESAE